MDRTRRSLRWPAHVIPLLLAVLTLCACATPPAAPMKPGEASDPVLQGHSQWCNTNPPSGYCDVDDAR